MYMTKSSNSGKKTTGKLPAVAPDVATDTAGMDAETASGGTDAPRVTRELEAIAPQKPRKHTAPTARITAPLAEAAGNAQDDASDANEIETVETPIQSAVAGPEDETGPSAEMSAPVATAHPYGADDPDATVHRATIAPPAPERPRHNTLASITRPRGSTNPNGAPPPPEPEPEHEFTFYDDEIPDETDYAAKDEEEWAVADQPTVALAPGSVLSARPQYLQTDEHSAWPPRPTPETPTPGSLPEAAASLHRRAVPRTDRTGLRRYASPTGRPMPGVPPAGIPQTAFPDPRMQRYQELQRRRNAKAQGEQISSPEKPVTDRVRQWWGDLRPGLKQALDYQHEVRASGVHPIPAYEPAPSSRLGDVFGRLTASARGLTERAQSAAAPAFKRLHNQAEQAAQAIVGRFEGDTARQQAPFLGPGRIAVFFRSGVSVGQAQRLLSSNEARPLRIIPRKHGFLAYVLPGTEEQISSRLRIHPYVRDVVFVAVDEYGDPINRDDE
jgi:hypothetical protein